MTFFSDFVKAHTGAKKPPERREAITKGSSATWGLISLI